MKIAMIGGQGHQSYALTALNEIKDCTFVAIAKGSSDENLDNFKLSIAEYTTVPKEYDNWIEMLDKEQPDAVSVAPIFCYHQRISLECIKRGIHVLCEKPVAINIQELDELEEALKNSKSQFIGMHAMRYSRHFHTVKKALDDGLIGKPILINSQKSYSFNATRPQFYKQRSLYGSTLCWVATHAIDWSYWYMGDFEISNAYHTTLCNQGYNDCESAGVIAFQFTTGAVGCINFDFLKAHKDIACRDSCRIAGEKGVLEAAENKAYITTHTEGRKELDLLPQKSFFKDFIDSTHGLDNCLIDTKSTLAVTRLALNARDYADKYRKE